jgi:hypothetical protein
MLEVLEIPEAPADLGPWLDSLVASPDLAAAVDDLSAIHGAAEEAPAVEEARAWLGSDVDAVLERGLGAIENARLRELLVRPALLPAIQELVFVEGGGYWNRIVAESTVATPAPQAAATRHRWLLAMAPLAIAASIAAFVALDMQRGPGVGGKKAEPDLTVMRGTNDDSAPSADAGLQPWGWGRTGLVDNAAEPAAIPGVLAAALEDWFRVTATADASDLVTLRSQTEELWAGCEQALALPLAGMAPDLRQGIRSQITLFQKRLQALLRRLDEGELAGSESAGAADLKRDVDALVRDTADALRRLE